jgi:uncharacterized protein
MTRTAPSHLPRTVSTDLGGARRGNAAGVTAAAWIAWVLLGLVLLPVAEGTTYAALVVLSAACVALWRRTPVRGRVDRRDVLVVGGIYAAVVALLSAAFRVFTTDNVLGLFLCFAGALLVGTIGPIVYMVWGRERPLSDLGLRLDNWKPTAALALLFGGVQFALTLWGYDLPAPVDWVPLLGMALVVGVFESVFFRGFVQGRLEESFGVVPGTALAALLYGAYHIGYGMDVTEIGFLTGLGLVYAVAYRLVRNILVLWPLLTPLGSFFANVEGGDIELPWASLLGFADVLALMVLALWLAGRRIRRRDDHQPLPTASQGDVS